MNRLLLTFVLCAFLRGAFAAEEITVARFPDADLVLVNDETRVEVNPDGTYETVSESRRKILTERGRREASRTTLDYSRRYGTGEIVSVRVIGTNGVERTVDVSATTKEATDNGSMSANIVDPLDRTIVCTIPGLAIGETVCVKTREKTFKARCEGQWADVQVFEWTCPIIRASYEVKLPPTLPLKSQCIRHPRGNMTESARTLADGSTVHLFTVTNSPQAFPEPDMPPLYTQIQHLRLSTAENWPAISTWYWNLCAPHLAKTNAEMVAKIAEIRRATETPTGTNERLLRAIFKFVSQEIRYMGLTMEDTSPGYAPHDVDITFRNRYGVCRDKAGLLTALLRAAGFEAFPVLIHVGAKHDPKVPQPFFNHAIVAVEDQSGTPSAGARSYTLMDPTNENTKDLLPAYESDKSYLVCRPEGEDLRLSPTPPPEVNSLEVESKGKFSKDGALFLENAINFNGVNDVGYRNALVRRKPDDRIAFFERVIKALSAGAELISCEIEPKDLRDTERPLRVRLTSRFPEAVLRGRTRTELTIPTLSAGLGCANFLLEGNTSLEKRRFPLRMDLTACTKERLSLDVSALGRPLELPEEKRISGGYDYHRAFSVSNGILLVTREVAVSKIEFSPDEYARLREDIKRVEADARRRPLFVEDPLRNADVRWIDDRTETDVVSDREWTTRISVSKEVLTYAGKRASAELKLTYNPAVETLEFLSAVVSNRNGTVRTVAPHEKNVMDCAWAAAAPRYPAGKILVVNLPSVEIGSVISYAYVRHVTNAPAAFYARYWFDSKAPLERRFVRVNDWSREVVRPPRLPDEPSQADPELWRDCVIVTSNRFEAVDLEIEAIDSPDPSLKTIRDFRDWMSRYVKVVGPGLYELPIAAQLTDPAVVLRERYATRLDYMRTLVALLRGAGYEADVVFSADDEDEPACLRRRQIFEKPDVRAFSTPLCRVRTREGGFLGWGARETTVFIGLENHYAPLGPVSCEGSDYFDPSDGTFGIVTVPEPAWKDFRKESFEFLVRENGSVDFTKEVSTWGASVGGFRRRWTEILPEDRARAHQSLLGAVAQAALATSELETDVTSYPARLRFSCFVPDYATCSGETISLRLPGLLSSLPTIVGTSRQTPFDMPSSGRVEQEVLVRLPADYTEIEHLPKTFSFEDPQDARRMWLTSVVSSDVREGCLEVRIVRRTEERPSAMFAPDYFEFVRDRDRLADSPANRTIVVRRAQSGGKK